MLPQLFAVGLCWPKNLLASQLLTWLCVKWHNKWCLMLWLMKPKRLHSPPTTNHCVGHRLVLPWPSSGHPDWHSVWPNMRVQMECLSSPSVVSNFTWQQPFGKKTLLIWLDNLFSHINSGLTGANEQCVINVRRLNASRMCSFASFRRGPDNYYPAPLEDMRAQLSDIYHI